MARHKTTVPREVAWSMYLRVLANFIFDKLTLSRGDIEELVRVHERDKKPGSTEKQIAARTKTFLGNLFSGSILHWPTFAILLRCIRAKRIRITVAIYMEDNSSSSFTVITEKETSNGDTSNAD